MRKFINVAAFFFFISTVFPVYAEETAGVVESPVITDNTKDTSSLEPLPVTDNSQADNQVNSDSSTGNPEDVFTRNVHVHPSLSARTFLTLVEGMNPSARKDFLGRNYTPLADMLHELEANDPEGLYPLVVSRLEADGIGITHWDGHRGPPRAIDDNPVNRMLEVKHDQADGRTEDAERKITALSTQYDSNSSVQTGVAEFFSEIKNYKDAEKYSTKAIEIDGQNTDAYKIRAASRYSMNDAKGAMEDIKKAMEIDPQDETGRLLTAIINSKKTVSLKNLSSLRDLKNALKDARGEAGDVYLGKDSGTGELAGPAGEMASVDYKKSQLYFKTAATKNQMGDYESALKYANLAIEKNQGNLDAYLERANANNFLGNYDEAIKDLTFVIGKDSYNANALNMRAWSLYKKGSLAAAGEDSSRALELKPDFADAMFNRALLYEKEGKYDDMLKELQSAASISQAYKGRFQDAVAQYAGKAPVFMSAYGKEAYLKPAGEDARQGHSSDRHWKKFLMILLFTVTGGVLIALGFIHIFSSSKPAESKITHPDVISPSVFYEGVATGKYKIVKKIGQGGMGMVYQATDQTLNRPVAIKKMNDEIKLNEREKQRFIEEARTVAMLHHPNIVEIYTIFEEGEDIYLVFEYIDGMTLDKKLDKEVRMSSLVVKEIALEIGKALAYAHGKNIIHRDMKLSNVMISSEGEVKVMDFGLAKIVRETMARISTTEVVGSPAYMAPEQDGGISLKESDIYSLGVCVYEMLAGEMPFVGPDYHYQKEKKSYVKLSQIVPGLEQGLDAVMEKALEPDPQNRYKSAHEFISELEKFL